MECLEADETDTVTVGEANQGSRKRKKRVTARESNKRKRYSLPAGANVFNPCNHATKTLFCSKVRPNHVKIFREKLYEKPDKIRQDSIIAALVHTTPVKRRRPRPCANNKKKKPGSEHSYNVMYYLTLEDEKVRVCKKFFLSVTKIGRTRLRLTMLKTMY